MDKNKSSYSNEYTEEVITLASEKEKLKRSKKRLLNYYIIFFILEIYLLRYNYINNGNSINLKIGNLILILIIQPILLYISSLISRIICFLFKPLVNVLEYKRIEYNKKIEEKIKFIENRQIELVSYSKAKRILREYDKVKSKITIGEHNRKCDITYNYVDEEKDKKDLDYLEKYKNAILTTYPELYIEESNNTLLEQMGILESSVAELVVVKSKIGNRNLEKIAKRFVEKNAQKLEGVGEVRLDGDERYSFSTIYGTYKVSPKDNDYRLSDKDDDMVNIVFEPKKSYGDSSTEVRHYDTRGNYIGSSRY